MRRHHLACIVFLFCFSFCAAPAVHADAASDLTSLDTTIRLLQEQLGRQIERIQASRQKVDSQMSLARIRIEEQLKKSGDDLSVQVEGLQRLREKLQQTMTDTDQAILLWKDQSSQVLAKTLSDISAQVNQTNELMQQLERIKSNVSGNCTNATGTDGKQSSITPSAPADGSQSPSPVSSPEIATVASLPPAEQPVSPTPSPG